MRLTPTPSGSNDFLVPDNWVSGSTHWSASLGSSPESHRRALLNRDNGSFIAPDDDDVNPENSLSWVFFQVLTAQQTIVVDFPADQQPMHTSRMEVVTIAMADSMTDGSLIAELTAVNGPSIELGNTVSEVAILHDNFEVTITGPGGVSSVTVDENSSATLVINVEPPLPDDQDRDVNLSYTNVISGETETISITVPAGSTSQDFSIFVGDDNIAAQPIRTFNVLLEPGDGYVRGTRRNVDINVLNDDLAEVSIFAVSDIVNEGASALFTVQVSNEIAVDLPVTINLATVGDFGISPGLGNTDVLITEGNTTVSLVVDISDDSIGGAYGSLTATIVSPLNLPGGADIWCSTDDQYD